MTTFQNERKSPIFRIPNKLDRVAKIMRFGRWGLRVAILEHLGSKPNRIFWRKITDIEEADYLDRNPSRTQEAPHSPLELPHREDGTQNTAPTKR